MEPVAAEAKRRGHTTLPSYSLEFGHDVRRREIRSRIKKDVTCVTHSCKNFHESFNKSYSTTFPHITITAA